ncbi:putative prefoldin subunit 5 [Elsinoe australis]|uniref:Putative prefoldin subunit 5 n=1 Tax=Elsinoe australis TaxID=40998 RepID=A0A4U7B727_9PEZI|nr:putative prefoldin subunit 5 [Elsinoe australis]
MSADAQKGQQVDLTQLPVPQLQQIQKQLSSEVNHLTNSYSSLRTAQSKFRDCITSINTGVRSPTSSGASTSLSSLQKQQKSLLVPLTTSLYVPGTLADPEKVLVDVGTGFYVEKGVDDAVRFYEAKVKELGESVKGLEQVVGQKQGSLRLVEEVMRGKMLAGEGGQGQGQGRK